MRLRRHAGLILFLLVLVALRSRGICDPFVHPYDGAFQEALAIGHLDYGLAVTKGLAVTAVVDGKPYYHASHPPLLQLIYAGLYSVFGRAEWVSRGVSLFASLLVGIVLWVLASRFKHPSSKYVTVFTFALMPLAAIFGMTTNYEPLALALISIIYLLITETTGGKRTALLVAAAILGGLFEWTVYLAWPAAVIMLYRRERSLRAIKPIIIPAIVAAITLAALFAWQRHVVGHIPVIEHAATRSNPVFLTSELLLDYFGRLKNGAGFVLFLAIIGFIHSARSASSEKDVIAPVIYFISIPILFLILAPQLVLVHPISQYYLVPMIAILAGLSCEVLRGILRKTVIAVVFISFIVMNRPAVADFHYKLANLIATEIGKPELVFDSSAVGYLKYYHGVETIHPLGGNEPSVAKIVQDERVRMFVVDTRNAEVGYVRDIVANAPGLSLLWSFPETQVWARGVDENIYRFANHLGVAIMPQGFANLWEAPIQDIVIVDSIPYYGIFQHSREGGSVIEFRDIPSAENFVTTAAFDVGRESSDHLKSCDGVKYKVEIFSGDWRRESSGTVGIREGQVMATPIKINLSGAPEKISVRLTVDPISNTSYDRFYWIDPKLTGVQAR